LAILALTAPLFAGTITLTVDSDDNNGTFTVGYSSYTGTKPVGLALEIDMPTGETISAQNTALYDGPSADSFFDVFLDYANDDPVTYEANASTATGSWLGMAHPLAVPGAAGSVTLPVEDVAICMGSLVGTAPASVTALATLTVGDGDADDCIIDLNTIRGGIVDADGNPMTVLCSVNGDTASALPRTFDVESCSYPACWDYPTQCHGDSDGDGDVDTDDWPAFRDGFGYVYPGASYNPCADYDRDGDTDTDDWPAFRDTFGFTPPANCTPGDINHIYCP